jgi:hypothetical protein
MVAALQEIKTIVPYLMFKTKLIWLRHVRTPKFKDRMSVKNNETITVLKLMTMTAMLFCELE